MQFHSKQFLALFSFLFVFALHAQEHDQYTLTYSSENPGVIAVDARITLEDSLLYMSPNSSKSDRFAGFVKGLEVSMDNGSGVNTTFSENKYWILNNAGAGDRIHLHYKLHIDHEKEEWPGGIDGVAYKRDYGIMTSGRSLFVMNGSQKEDIRIKIETPEQWIASTPWNALAGDETSYRVPNLDQLQESFIFAGTHEEVLLRREGFTLKFILGGNHLISQKDKITGMANDLLDYYIELMGGIPNPAPGVTLDQCMVIITENEAVDGEVIGNHISMFMDPEADLQSQTVGWFIFAHEFFHLWNGKSIKFAGTTSDWFKEGFSNYYTIKGLYQVGFIDEPVLKGILNNLFYQRYINDPGLGTMSPVTCAEGFSKDQHWGLIYGGGLFAGIAADMEIRQSSGNERSLDDLMRALYRQNGGTNDYLSNDILVKGIQETGYEGFDAFFTNYLNGNKVISLAPHLDHAGIQVTDENKTLDFSHREEKTPLEASIWEGFLGN